MSVRSDRASLVPALDAIDHANAADPNLISGRPRALVQGERATLWLDRLDPQASDALVLATRAHHVRRWTSARSSYPDGRAGYLRWRRDLKAVHAETLGELLPACGIGAGVVARAQQLVAKRGDQHEPEAQAFEDVVCLVFLETQFEELIDRLDEQKTIDVLQTRAEALSLSRRSFVASCSTLALCLSGCRSWTLDSRLAYALISDPPLNSRAHR